MSKAIHEADLNQPVTQHMRQDFTQLQMAQTVGEALVALRQKQPEGRIIYFYVVDEAGRLQGVVPTRRLLLTSPDTPIAEIMVRDVITIPMSATVLDACEFFILHRLLAFPVIDQERRIMGTVDVEVYTEELTELDSSRRNDDLFQLVGVHLAEAQQTAPVLAFRSRFPWLLCNLAGGILAAFFAGLYEHELQRVVALALFIPVVLALAESVSVQSVSLALQALHGKPPTLRVLLERIRWESLTGMLLGAATGLIVGAVSWLWLGDARVSVCVLAGIAGGVTGAAVVGIALPNVLRLLRRDPQVAAGPVALAAADMITLLLYFNVARWLLA
jgi:magnesium transporter